MEKDSCVVGVVVVAVVVDVGTDVVVEVDDGIDVPVSHVGVSSRFKLITVRRTSFGGKCFNSFSEIVHDKTSSSKRSKGSNAFGGISQDSTG